MRPGTLCQVHVPDHHGGALDAVNSKLGIARRMEGDVAVFESHVTGHHEFRSKNYWAYDLRPGLSAHAYLRQKTDPHRKPTACLPADGRPPQEQYHIIPLMGIVHTQREIPDSHAAQKQHAYSRPSTMHCLATILSAPYRNACTVNQI